MPVPAAFRDWFTRRGWRLREHQAAMMEAATKERELSGDKAQRIVDAMRDSVARRGAAGKSRAWGLSPG